MVRHAKIKTRKGSPNSQAIQEIADRKYQWSESPMARPYGPKKHVRQTGKQKAEKLGDLARNCSKQIKGNLNHIISQWMK